MLVDEKVIVGMVGSTPKYVSWKGKSHTVTQIGLHHYYRRGKTLYHVFSVAAGTLFMRLCLDTDSLIWKLEEISDNV